MAFQTPLTLPVTAVTNDLLPYLSNTLAAPWRRSKRSSGNASPTVSQRRAASQATLSEASSEPHSVPLPECLDQASIDVLRLEFENLQFAPPSALSKMSRTINLTRRAPSIPSLSYGSTSGAGRTVWTKSPLSAANATLNFSSARSYSTQSILQLSRRQSLPKPRGLSRSHQSRFLFGGASQNLLANREKTANNNPSSATAQNAFYTALLRANMPSIIAERYESGRFASNAFSDSVYSKAVQQMGGESASGQGSGDSSAPETLQAVGQAIAGSQGHTGRAGVSLRQNGSKDPRLYVVMEESRTSAILRWVKFFLYFGFTAYLTVTLLSILVETTGALKTVQSPKNSEAQRQKVRFNDVHGCEEAKDELQELVEFLKNPDRFNSLGGKLPKGVLLVGPPGTGKTLLARAVAGEAGVPFFYMSGSEFDEVYVGVGAKRVRELFQQARGKAPAIIFIDELDAVGGKRNERDAAYVKQTLNQLLTELDGFSQTSGVIVLAATNYPELLDKALTRPGRFDRRVEVPLPDVRGRVNILNHHIKSVPISTDVDLTVIARGTPGFSGADLENLVNQAAIRASRDKKPKVGPRDFDWAKDKIVMGAENRSRVLRDEDKLTTAYHEAGHALVAHFSKSATPLYKITIVPRGVALGVTHFLPEMDIVSKDYSEYLADIDVSMGGKAAEQLIFGHDKVTSGISEDIRQATGVAQILVTRLGYSQKIGNVDFGTEYTKLSSETKQEIEAEVRRILKEASDRASAILKERRHELELLTKALIEYETLTKDEMEKILKGEKLDKLDALPKAPVMLPDALLGPGIRQRATDAAGQSKNSSQN